MSERFALVSALTLFRQTWYDDAIRLAEIKQHVSDGIGGRPVATGVARFFLVRHGHLWGEVRVCGTSGERESWFRSNLACCVRV